MRRATVRVVLVRSNFNPHFSRTFDRLGKFVRVLADRHIDRVIRPPTQSRVYVRGKYPAQCVPGLFGEHFFHPRGKGEHLTHFMYPCEWG
jgi:hypothetical protein